VADSRTASARLTRDSKSVTTAILWTIILVVFLAAVWPTPADEDPYCASCSGEGSGSTAASVLIGLVCASMWIVVLRKWRARSEARAHDRWQAKFGPRIDWALSGGTFRAAPTAPSRAGDGIGAGWEATSDGADVAEWGSAGAAVGGPLMVGGIAVMAVAGLFGLAKAGVQAKRDREVTRIVRGEVRSDLLRHLARLNAQCPRNERSRARLERDKRWTESAVKTLEHMGYAE